MFPATTVVGHRWARIEWTSRVVVVLPFVPVTPIVGAGQAARNSVISISMRAPCRSVTARNGESRRTSGLRTTTSAQAKSASSWRPRVNVTGLSRNSSTTAANRPGSPRSVTRTSAPASTA